jgi:serine/threonine protein kinase
MVAFVEPLGADDPRQVGGFRLQARLGAGGMGRVYLGYSPGGRPVAVKIVHPELARDPEFMQRFRREVAAAQTVSDAYTAAVVGAGPDDSPPWLATTFVPGPPLADLVARAGPLPEAAVWRLAGGLAEALQAIHAKGLVHRDLKPDNILIAADGPRVIDFGISRTTSGTVLTATRTTIGTPGYMSPEQAQGHAVGPSSDIFSLGSVLAFAATGVSPFGSGEIFAVTYRVVQGEPDLTHVPASLRSVIEACLAKDPAARPDLGQLIDAVAASSAAYPEVTPGKFWPDQVSAVLESGAFAPTLPPSRIAPPPSPATQAADVNPAAHAPPPSTIAPPPSPATQAADVNPAPHAPHAAGTVVRRRRPRWLLPVVLGAVVATGAGVAIALAVSPAPKPPGFLSVRSGTPTATVTNSPVAITVCTVPASGCTLAGAARDMAERPQQIDATGDGSQVVTGLSWTGWGSSRATATGTLRVNDCQPNCANGKFAGYPATVTVSGLTRYGGTGSGLEAYSAITIKAPSAPTKTYTFTQDTIPT